MALQCCVYEFFSLITIGNRDLKDQNERRWNSSSDPSSSARSSGRDAVRAQPHNATTASSMASAVAAILKRCHGPPTAAPATAVAWVTGIMNAGFASASANSFAVSNRSAANFSNDFAVAAATSQHPRGRRRGERRNACRELVYNPRPLSAHNLNLNEVPLHGVEFQLGPLRPCGFKTFLRLLEGRPRPPFPLEFALVIPPDRVRPILVSPPGLGVELDEAKLARYGVDKGEVA